MAGETQQWFGYRHSGVAIASAFELPEWAGFAESAAIASSDVTVEMGEAAPVSAEEIRQGEKAFAFSIPEIGRWSVAEGKRINVEPDPAAAMREIRLFTLGSAWGALGYQRGWAMLHGSAVSAGDGAALFCGDSGRGKSTMAATLVERGRMLLADDLSRVDVARDGPPLLYPASRRIKLWTDALERLDLADRELTRDHFRDDKFHLDASSGTPPTSPVALRSVHILEWANELSHRRLRGAEAATALFEATVYRPQFLEPMGLLGAQALFCARMAGSCAVYRLTRPRDLAALDRVCELLESGF